MKDINGRYLRSAARILCLACCFLGATPLLAQSRLVYPRIIFQQGRWSGIAIVNPGTAPATITVESFNPDGTTFVAPMQRTINPGSQYADLALALLSVPSSISLSLTPRRIWLQVSSDADGLTGFYLEGNDGPDFMDGSSLEGNGTDLFLPLVENKGSSSTEISFVNPDSDDTASITVDFLQDDGKTAASRLTTIPKSGALLGPISEYFALSYEAVTALRIRSDRPVTCQATIYRSSDRSLVTVPAVEASLPARLLRFPQLAQGGGWSTSLGISNLGSAQAVVTLTAYDPSGKLIADSLITENPVTRIIPAGGTLRSGAKELFGVRDTSLRQGWIKAETTAAILTGYVEYGAGTNRALVPARSDGSAASLFSHQAMANPYYTGLAVLNGGTLAANVEVVSLRADGQLLGKTQRLLRPGQRESLLLQDWIPTLAETTGGAVYVKGDASTVATQLYGTRLNTALANVPPQEVPAGYNPGASTSSLSVTPPLAIVETKKTQRFIASSTSPTPVAWRVNGISAGNSTYGTIAADGTYTAPALTPTPPTVTIEAVASSGALTAGATLDVVQRETLVQGLTLVTSVAYLESARRFFIAEQTALASAPVPPHAASVDARILEAKSSGGQDLFTTIPGDAIAKMLPYEAGSGAAYLLLAGNLSGKIYRLALDSSRTLTTIESGFTGPTSLALDPASGDLLVSEAGGLSVIPREKFDPAAAAGSAVAAPAGDAGSTRRELVSLPHPQGVVFDRCTRTLYAATADGRLIQYQGNRVSTLLANLGSPRQMLALYRSDSPCEAGLALLLAESSRILLVRPKEKSFIPFVPDAAGIFDMAFFPQAYPFLKDSPAAVILAERQLGTGQSRILRIPIGPTFDNRPPLETARDGSGLPLLDPPGDTFETDRTVEAGVRAPDLLAVTAQAFPTGVALNLRFARPVVPLRTGLPAGLAGFVDFDYEQGGTLSHVELYNPFGIVGRIGMDAYIDLGRELFVRGGNTFPASLRYQREFVTIWIPSGFFDPLKARFGVVVGNRLEATDVAPAAGMVRFAP